MTTVFNPRTNESKLEKRTACISCGTSFGTVYAPFEAAPRPLLPGDYVVCGCCGEFLQFTESGKCILGDFNAVDQKFLKEMDILQDTVEAFNNT